MPNRVITDTSDPVLKYSQAFATDSDLEMARTLHKYVDEKLMPRRLDMEGGFHRDEELARKAIEEVGKGLIALDVGRAFLPEEYGGLGLTSMVTFNIMMEEIGRGDLGLATHLMLYSFVFAPAMFTNNEAVLGRWAPLYCDDEYRTACIAFTEPAGGCNIDDPTQHGRTLRTMARLEGDEWVINGQKLWPGGIGHAEVYCTICTVDPDLGSDGVVILYVPKDTPGLSAGEPEEKMGMLFVEDNGSIFYDDVRVPKEYCAGAPGGEGGQAFDDLGSTRFNDAAMILGAAQACLEIVEDYLADRLIVGKPVRERSLHAALIGEMVAKIQAGRSYHLNCAYMYDHPEIYGDSLSRQQMARSAACKWFCTGVAEWVIRECMGLLGSYGYVREYHIEKYYRDAPIVRMWQGGAHGAILQATQGEYAYEPWI